MTDPGYSAGGRSVDELGSPPEGVGSGVRDPAAQPERWMVARTSVGVCPCASSPLPPEPGSGVELVDAVPAASLDALREVAKELAEALQTYHEKIDPWARAGQPTDWPFPEFGAAECKPASAVLDRWAALSAPSTGGDDA